MKVCCRCHVEQEETQFSKDRKRKDGLAVTCKTCVGKYYLVNRGHIMDKSAKYYTVNKVKIIRRDVAKRLPTRAHVKGTVKLESSNASGIIAEYVVECVLNDTLNLNKVNFHSDCDLVSKSLGRVDVKSSQFYIRPPRKAWHFAKKAASKIPDNYVCLGFDEGKTKILHVWVIPGDSAVVAVHGVWISESRLKRVSQYEIDSTPYNTVYQNLNVHELPEFKNLKY